MRWERRTQDGTKNLRIAAPFISLVICSLLSVFLFSLSPLSRGGLKSQSTKNPHLVAGSPSQSKLKSKVQPPWVIQAGGTGVKREAQYHRSSMLAQHTSQWWEEWREGDKGELPFNKNNFTFFIDSGNLRTIKAAILTQKHHLIHSCAVFSGRILRDKVQNFFKGVLSVFNHCPVWRVHVEFHACKSNGWRTTMYNPFFAKIAILIQS